MNNYGQLVDRIAESAKLAKDEIERRVEAKRAKLSGLVSKEGAAQIVAAELGISFDKERMKISELVHGMRKANVVGKVLEVYPVREYNKNGRGGKIGSFLIADSSSNIRVVLCDVNHISLIEQGKLKVGDVLEISNGSVRTSELHLGSFSDIKPSRENVGEVVTKRVIELVKLKDKKAGQSLKNRAFILQVFEPKYFQVCSECGKKIVEGKCAVHGENKSTKRALLNIVLDDGSESIRAVLFGEHIGKLGFSEEEIFSLEKFNGAKNKLIGEEMIFSGNIRVNALFNNNEFTVDGIESVKADELIKELENKVL